MPDIEQVIVFRHCTGTYANLCRRYAVCAAKKLAECERELWRWEENLNWQNQGCTVVASHLDNLHATSLYTLIKLNGSSKTSFSFFFFANV